MSFDHIPPRASVYWADLATRYWKQTKARNERFKQLHIQVRVLEAINRGLEERCADLEERLAEMQDTTESNRGYARLVD
jgi:predicted RNase H-like nuclease (RuvC/YqgF family)